MYHEALACGALGVDAAAARRVAAMLRCTMLSHAWSVVHIAVLLHGTCRWALESATAAATASHAPVADIRLAPTGVAPPHTQPVSV